MVPKLLSISKIQIKHFKIKFRKKLSHKFNFLTSTASKSKTKINNEDNKKITPVEEEMEGLRRKILLAEKQINSLRVLNRLLIDHLVSSDKNRFHHQDMDFTSEKRCLPLILQKTSDFTKKNIADNIEEEINLNTEDCLFTQTIQDSPLKNNDSESPIKISFISKHLEGENFYDHHLKLIYKVETDKVLDSEKLTLLNTSKGIIKSSFSFPKLNIMRKLLKN